MGEFNLQIHVFVVIDDIKNVLVTIMRVNECYYTKKLVFS